jgi:hypothetical protein
MGPQILKLPGEILYMLTDNTKGAVILVADMIPVGRRRNSFKQEGHDDTGGKNDKPVP